jgi:putative transposase
MQRFKSPGSAQRFLNIQSAVYNNFYLQRHLLNRENFKQYRSNAFDVWMAASAAA